MIGMTLPAGDPALATTLITEADRAGVDAVWLQAGGVSSDPLAIFAAAARQTERVHMGTAIVPIWPRHPLALVQQLQVVEALAPGRVTLGVGTSTPRAMRAFGAPFRAPLSYLRQYVRILRAALDEGVVDFDGNDLSARARFARPLGTPVMISALQRSAFRLAGEVAAGAITWVCPPEYVRSVGRPAIEAGAQQAGREAPPIVLHVPVCRTTDRSEAVRRASATFGAYTHFEFYRDMFAAAGHPPGTERAFSPELADALVVYGTDEKIMSRLRDLADEFGQVMVGTIAPEGVDPTVAVRDVISLLGRNSDEV